MINKNFEHARMFDRVAKGVNIYNSFPKYILCLILKKNLKASCSQFLYNTSKHTTLNDINEFRLITLS